MQVPPVLLFFIGQFSSPAADICRWEMGMCDAKVRRVLLQTWWGLVPTLQLRSTYFRAYSAQVRREHGHEFAAAGRCRGVQESAVLGRSY